jgi:hypothetical protein
MSVDKDLEINARGLPACRANRRDLGFANFLRKLEKACGDAIVGRGRVGILVSFPGQIPRSLSSRVVVFNNGVRDGATLLHAAAEAGVGDPRLLSARIEVRRKGFGWTAQVRTPAIADGSGAITNFSLNLHRDFTYRGRPRSLFSARCPDGKFKLSMPKLVFRNEANVPGVAPRTILKGSLQVPCRPRR